MDCNFRSQPVAEVWSFADSLEWLAPSGSVNELQRPSVTAKGTKKAGGRFHLVPLPRWSRTQLHTDLSFHHLCLQEISSFCFSVSRWCIQIDIILSSKKIMYPHETMTIKHWLLNVDVVWQVLGVVVVATGVGICTWPGGPSCSSHKQDIPGVTSKLPWVNAGQNGDTCYTYSLWIFI